MVGKEGAARVEKDQIMHRLWGVLRTEEDGKSEFGDNVNQLFQSKLLDIRAFCLPVVLGLLRRCLRMYSGRAPSYTACSPPISPDLPMLRRSW